MYGPKGGVTAGLPPQNRRQSSRSHNRDLADQGVMNSSQSLVGLARANNDQSLSDFEDNRLN